MRFRINPWAFVKPLGLLFLYYSAAGYALYTCSQYMSLGYAVQQQWRDLDAAEAICRQHPQCADGVLATDQ
jgi:hypothetical protein